MREIGKMARKKEKELFDEKTEKRMREALSRV